MFECVVVIGEVPLEIVDEKGGVDGMNKKLHVKITETAARNAVVHTQRCLLRWTFCLWSCF